MDEGAAEDMVVEEEQPEDEDENEDVEGREFENEGEGEDEDRTDHVRYIPGSGASHKGSCVGASRGHT